MNLRDRTILWQNPNLRRLIYEVQCKCTVQSCAYHCDNENYCSLDRILVGTHEANPTQDQCTDCKSFRKK